MELFWIGALIFWLLCGVYAAHIAEQKHAGNQGFWLGLLLGPLGVVAAGFLDNRPLCSECGGRLKGTPQKPFRLCPHCRAELRAVTYTAAPPDGDWSASIDEARRQFDATRTSSGLVGFLKHE